jgi:hypothetical protein
MPLPPAGMTLRERFPLRSAVGASHEGRIIVKDKIGVVVGYGGYQNRNCVRVLFPGSKKKSPRTIHSRFLNPVNVEPLQPETHAGGKT